MEDDCLDGGAANRGMGVLNCDPKASLDVGVLWKLRSTRSPGNHCVVPKVKSAGELPKFSLMVVWMDSRMSGR